MKVLTILLHRRQNNYQQKGQYLNLYLSSFGVIILLCVLMISLSACNSFLSAPAQSGTPSTDIGTTNDIATPTLAASPRPNVTTPSITLQVTGCPSGLTINWDNLVGTHPNVNKVQKVICGSLEGAGTLDALVDVRYYSSDARLDVYVYDNLSGTPNRRFSLQGLVNGDALISSVGTLVTAESNPNDPIKGSHDLFKEYQWNGTSFAQISFPYMYPDMTRYQAEQNQALISSELAALQPGQPTSSIKDSWRLTAGSVVSHMAQFVFHWQPTKYIVTLPSNAGKLLSFSVTVTNLATGGGGFIAAVYHLNGVPTNIFEVSQVSSINQGAAISNPQAGTRLSSPISVSGSAVASGNVLGQVVIYDDMYTNLGDSGPISSPASSGYVQFTNSVSYHLGITGPEDGVVAFYATNQNNAALSNQVVMVKVFLSA